jgi:hypothetical protein
MAHARRFMRPSTNTSRAFSRRGTIRRAGENTKYVHHHGIHRLQEDARMGISVNEAATRDEERIRTLLEDVYVRDMYVKRDRGAFSREFARCFHMLSPTLDGATGEPTDVHWGGLDEILANHPKAILRSVRFEVPWVDVAGHAAVARVDVFDAEEWIYTDYVSLYRVKGAWKVISKVFHRHGPSVAAASDVG